MRKWRGGMKDQLMMKKNWIHGAIPTLMLSALGLLSAACSGGGQEAPKDGDAVVKTVADSDAVSLALLPTVDCLPFYYAAEQGYFDRQGVKVNLLTFDAQTDCDTAIVGQTGAVGVTNLPRAIMARQKYPGYKVVAATDGSWALVAGGGLRLKKLSQLRLRTVGISRFSSSDYYAARAMTEAGVDADDALCPQINALELRASMLNEDQIDAAVLPEPFVTMARLNGHKVLRGFATDSVRTGCLALNTAVRRPKGFDEKLVAVMRAYNMAVDALNARGKDGAALCRSVLVDQLKMPPAVADSLRLPAYARMASPRTGDVEAARLFLVSRGQIGRNTTFGNMIDTTYCAKSRQKGASSSK